MNVKINDIYKINIKVSNLEKLKELGFQFWIPKQFKTSDYQKKNLMFLANKEMLILISKKDFDDSSHKSSTRFLNSLCSVLSTNKPSLEEVEDLSDVKKVKLILIFAEVNIDEFDSSIFGDIPKLNLDSINHILNDIEIKKKDWLMIREYS